MKIMIIFSGQGYQKPGLFHVFQDDKRAMKVVKEWSALTGIDLLNNKTALLDPNFTQIILSAYQSILYQSIFELLTSHQVDMSGYSLGEVNAFFASCHASSSVWMKAIDHRTRLMTSLLQKSPQTHYDLLSIKGRFDLNLVRKRCADNHCDVAIINSEQHIIVAGSVFHLQQLLAELSMLHVNNTKFLGIKLPSHTPFYTYLKHQFRDYLVRECALLNLNYPILNPIALQKVYDMQEEIELLDKALYTTLNWHRNFNLMAEYGYDLIIDLGPGSAMTSLACAVNPRFLEINVLTLAHFTSLDGIKVRIKQLIQ